MFPSLPFSAYSSFSCSYRAGEGQGRVPGLPAPALLAGSQLGLLAPGPVLVLPVHQLPLHLPSVLVVDLHLALLLRPGDIQVLDHLPVQGLLEPARDGELVVLTLHYTTIH